MSKPTHVLVFPAGEINAVELHDALATCVNVKLFGASSVERHGAYIFRNYISGLPMISDETFFDTFNALLSEHEIDVIFPTHDTVAMFFADNQDKINAKIIVADKVTSEVCRDKRRTYELFADCDFVPRLYGDASEPQYPAFLKPRIGQGSVDAHKVAGADELVGVNLDDYVLADYLPGEEYTVDCLTDKEGKLQIISPRSRDRTFAGVTVSGKTQPLADEIRDIAEEINRRMSFLGLWFFQVKKDSAGRFKLLEISTRCAGTMCLTRARGVNLPLLSVYAALGYDISVTPNTYTVTVDRTLISRYIIDYEYNTVYLDFDDTVVINGTVHPYSIMFIYQCRNAGKKIILLTKHAKVIHETLAEYDIAESLFAEIVPLQPDEAKVAKINPNRAIFIDNAFQERKLVQEAYGIPVFDVDGLEVLLDWRT